MTDIDAVITKLTKAMREGLLRSPCPSWWGSAPACMPYRKATADALAARGLCLRYNPTMRWGNARPLTPLGASLRARLQEQNNGR